MGADDMLDGAADKIADQAKDVAPDQVDPMIDKAKEEARNVDLNSVTEKASMTDKVKGMFGR